MAVISLRVFTAAALAAVAALTAFSVLGADPAAASFPGENGRIAYSSNDGADPYNISVWAMNPDSTGHVNLTRDQPCCNWNAKWSPDGKKLAYMTDRDGNTDVFVMDADGSNPTRLTDGPTAEHSPTWSPDGTRVAFVSNRDGQSEIYVMDVDGSDPKRITGGPEPDGAPSWAPSWSPDGTRLAFVSRAAATDGGYCPSEEIFTINADGSGDRRMLTHHGDYWCDDYFTGAPDWSPDGTEITYAHGAEYFGSSVYAVSADGSAGRKVAYIPAGNWSRVPAPDGMPTWSPDGTKIAFWGEGFYESRVIFAVNSDGSGEPKSLTKLGECYADCPDFGPFRPSWGTAASVPSPPPDTAITDGPSGTVRSDSARFRVSSDQRVVRYECSLDGAAFARCAPPQDFDGLSEGEHALEVRAVDGAGTPDASPAKRTWTVDAKSPQVDVVSPVDGARGVARGTNLEASFSETMDPTTINRSTFRIYRCDSNGFTNCANRINSVVSPSADGLRAVLNPYGASETGLRAKTGYKAVITTGAEDSAGSPLDQNDTTTGDQQEVWRFTTRGR